MNDSTKAAHEAFAYHFLLPNLVPADSRHVQVWAQAVPGILARLQWINAGLKKGVTIADARAKYIKQAIARYRNAAGISVIRGGNVKPGIVEALKSPSAKDAVTSLEKAGEEHLIARIKEQVKAMMAIADNGRGSGGQDDPDAQATGGYVHMTKATKEVINFPENQDVKRRYDMRDPDYQLGEFCAGEHPPPLRLARERDRSREASPPDRPRGVAQIRRHP